MKKRLVYKSCTADKKNPRMMSSRVITLFANHLNFQVGADIVKKALSYPLKLIAKNAGVNGSVVSEKVIKSPYISDSSLSL